MLYFSRYARDKTGKLVYGVIDTDDNTEAFVDWSGFLDAVKRGVTIAGVRLDGTNGLTCTPYQYDAYRTSLQAKYAMLGVNIIVCKSRVTHISLDVDRIGREPVRVRLSDFGTEVSDLLLAGNPTFGRRSWLPEYTKVVLILDDKLIKIRKFFSDLSSNVLFVGNAGVVFDIQELSNKEAIRNLYKSIRAQYGTSDVIIDKKSRKAHMKLLGFTYEG